MKTKKSLLLVASLTLAVLMQLALTGVSSAAPPQKVPFEATGAVYISGPYNSWQAGPFEFARNEPVDTVPNTSLTSDWDAMNGGVLSSLHHGYIAFNPDGTFEGQLKGAFTITAANGEGALEGKMQGKVTGTWDVSDPQNMVGTYIQDAGNFFSTRGTGLFAGYKAEGTWQVHLLWDAGLGTYIGTISVDGYRVKLLA